MFGLYVDRFINTMHCISVTHSPHRHSRLTVLSGALAALVVMTILSTYVGYAATIIPRVYTQYLSCVLFAIFGIKMLYEGWHMSPDEGQEEYEEVSVSNLM